MGVSSSAFTACSAVKLAPLLSIVTLSGTPFCRIDFSKYCRAAALFRLARRRKSTVWPFLVHGPVEVLPFSPNLHIGFVHPPALADRSLAPAEGLLKRGQKLDGPAVHRGMIDRNSTLGHHFLEMTQAKRIGNVPTHAGQHYFQRIVQPFEHPCHTRIQRLHSSPTRPFRSKQINRRPYCDKTVEGVPVKRVGTPDDIAHSVAYFLQLVACFRRSGLA